VVNPGDAAAGSRSVASSSIDPLRALGGAVNTDAVTIDTVIIGAGQAGLSVGYHLTRQGRRVQILDANERIGDSWRNRWDSLRLFTPSRYDGLPGMRYAAPAWTFPTKDEMAAFLEAYAQRFDLPVRNKVTVDRVFREGERYVVAAGNHRWEARNVVVATGAFSTPRIPVFASELDPAVVQLHSSEYRNPSQLRAGGALVVGAGNSGAEIAIDVARAGQRTWLSGRDTGQEAPFRIGSLPDRLLTPPVWLLFSRALTTKNRVGRALRRKALTTGAPLVRVRPADLAGAGVERLPRVAGVREGLPMLEDGRVTEVANVIWCTGFRPDYRWIDLQGFNEDGASAHERGVLASYPGLYFVGEFFLHSLTSSLVGGVGRDAEHIAKHIVSRQPGEAGRRTERPYGDSITA
jgi:putative flavoprotein involved in K+ transport